MPRHERRRRRCRAAADTGSADAPPRHAAGRGAALAAGLIFLGLALLPLVAAVIDDPFLTVTATRIMIFALAALSLDLILGYGAMVSFGHAAFLGIGAYAVGILAANGVGDLLLQIVAAILAAASSPSSPARSRCGPRASISS